MNFKPEPKLRPLLSWVSLFIFTLGFAFQNNVTRQINGQDASVERIEQGSNLFNSNCASCHALDNKVVGPPLAGVIDKYEEDYDWMVAWIKNNTKLVKAGDPRAKAIYDEYNGSPMNIFENLSDDQITSILMWIDNGGDGDTPEAAAAGAVSDTPVDESLYSKVNWMLVLLCVLVFVIVAMVFGILELVSNVTGRKVVDWNNINAFMMLLFIVLFFVLTIYEYTIHKQYLLPESASLHGMELDKMMRWTFIATLPVFFITQFLLFFFSFKYRQKPGNKAYYYPHNNNLEYIWTTIPAIVLAVLVFGGFKTWNKILRTDNSSISNKVELFAYQFGWSARYPGEDGKLGKANFNLINGTNPLGVANKDHAKELLNELTEDIASLEEAIERLDTEEAALRSTLGGRVGRDRKDHLLKINRYASGEAKRDLELTIRARNTQIDRLKRALATEKGNMFDGSGNDDLVVQELHLVVNEPVTLKFRARDVIHSAYLPYFRTQMNVVPGLPTEFTFTPTKTTRDMQGIKNDAEFDYYLVCNKICGNAHFNMKMKVVVETADEYKEWIETQSPLFVDKVEEPEDDAEENMEETETTETVALN